DVRLESLYLACPRCPHRAYPLDDRLGVTGFVNPQARKLLCLTGTSGSFDRAAEHLAEFSLNPTPWRLSPLPCWDCRRPIVPGSLSCYSGNKKGSDKSWSSADNPWQDCPWGRTGRPLRRPDRYIGKAN